MLRLYDYLDSGNGYKIRLLLSQLNTPFEYREVDILKGESRTAAFLAMNPNGKIPVLQLEDGTYLSESNAILFFLAEDTQYLPAERLSRGRVLQWLFFEQYSHEPNIATRRFMLKHVAGAARSPDALQRKLNAGYQALDIMEEHLGQRDFFVGGSYSIADIGLFAYTHVADEGGFKLSGYPNILAWCERIRSQAGFRELYSDW